MSLFDSEQATLDEFVLELKHSSVADSIALTPDDADDKRVSNKKYLLHKKLGVHLVEKFNRYFYYYTIFTSKSFDYLYKARDFKYRA